MSKKLYVGNLPFSVGFEDLKKLFESYGKIVEATVIADKFTKRSKGFGFITLEDDSMADKAIAEMNGKEVQGRALKVSEAKPMEDKKEENKE